MTRRAVAFAFLVVSLTWPARAQDRAETPAFPAPDRPVASIVTPEYSDENTRDAHQEAQRVLNRLGIIPGQRVADIGAGLGYYTVRVARRLGPGATIYATDVKAEYLSRLTERLAREKITGVRVILGLPRDPRLPTNSVDVAILSHVYHEIENPYEFLYRLLPALAPGARVGIVDVDQPTQHHGTPPALLRCELAAVGYPLSANMGETVTPLQFSVEGESGLERDERIGAGRCWAGNRGGDEGNAATVHGGVQAEDRPGGRRL